MADFGAPVAQNIDTSPNKGLETISSLMGIQRQRLGLEGQAAEVQQQQQTAKQRAAMATVDWTKHIGQDGVLDTQSFSQDPAIRRAAGDQYPQILEHANLVRNGQIQNKQALFGLTKDQNDALLQKAGGLAGDRDVQADNPVGRTKVGMMFDQFGQQYGPDAARVAAINRPMVDHAPQGKLASSLNVLSLQAADASHQIAATTAQPSSIDQGGTVQPGTTGGPLSAHPGAFTPAGRPVAKNLPPQIVTSPVTKGLYATGPNGSVTPIGGADARTAPGGPPFNPSYQGQEQDVAAFQHEVQSTRQEAQQAPLARNINAQILRLADNAKTGPGSEVWQHVIGAVGAPFGLSPSASYQEVGKFLEKNAISNMTAMGGPPSDSRLEAAAKANGSTSFSPEALKTVTKFNDATTTALDKYRQGMDHAVGMGKSVDYTKLPEFKAAWAKNFDVDVFRVENAMRDGDKGELAKIKSELGPEKLKALAEKRRNLERLNQTGSLQ